MFRFAVQLPQYLKLLQQAPRSTSNNEIKVILEYAWKVKHAGVHNSQN